MSARIVVPADVLWWDSSNVYIKCPFCGEEHHHGLSWANCLTTPYQIVSNAVGVEPESRAPHCRINISQPPYQFHFPIDEDNKAAKFEIDKEKRRFHVAGWVEKHVSDDEAELLCLQALSLVHCPESKDCDAIGGFWCCHVLGNGTCCPETHAVFRSHCILGNVRAMKAMLHRLKQRGLEMQLVSAKDKGGHPPLVLAATEGRLDVVKFLLENNADFDAKGYGGRTALMEAALWGRWAVAYHLIAIGADIDAVDARGRTASDYAEDTELNEVLRRNISPLCTRTAEQIWTDSFSRQVIFQALKSLRPTKTIPKDNTQCAAERNAQFKKLENDFDLVLVQPVARWSLSTEYKTVAIMNRGDPFPEISSHSGWAHQTGMTKIRGICVLSGKEWTDKVLELSELIGYSLEVVEQRDNGHPGKYSASHAEKQLMAYFVEKHVFLPQERAEGHALRRLSLIEPKYSLRRADILVSKAVCRDCQGFREKLEKFLHISFELRATT